MEGRKVSDLEVIDYLCDMLHDVRSAPIPGNIIGLNTIGHNKVELSLRIESELAEKIKNNEIVGAAYFIKKDEFFDTKLKMQGANVFDEMSPKNKLEILMPRIQIMIAMIKDVKLNYEKFLIPKGAMTEDSITYQQFLEKYYTIFPKEKQ